MVHASGVPGRSIVRAEILPVTCSGGAILALAQQHTAPVPGWCRELPPHLHPTHVVVDALARDLGVVFDQARTVVHSTSWRYEGARLVLSYLAALPALPVAPPGYVLQPVDSGANRLTRTGEPAAIPVLDVLAHGLRHLAMLRVSDVAISDVLADCWHDLLAEWDPLPAGLLEHSVPASGGPMQRRTVVSSR